MRPPEDQVGLPHGRGTQRTPEDVAWVTRGQAEASRRAVCRPAWLRAGRPPRADPLPRGERRARIQAVDAEGAGARGSGGVKTVAPLTQQVKWRARAATVRARPPAVWPGRIPYRATDEDGRYLATMPARATSQIVGWAPNAPMTQDLAGAALDRAVGRISPRRAGTTQTSAASTPLASAQLGWGGPP